MGYLVLLGILGLPFMVIWCFMLAMAMGLFHERTDAESIAHSYGLSWKTSRH
jgi:hypothetical protein